MNRQYLEYNLEIVTCLSSLAAPNAPCSASQITVARVEQFGWPPGTAAKLTSMA